MGILGQPIKESLAISDTQLGLLTGIMFAVFYAVLGMPMAMWADRNNRRNLISFSVFTWSFMTALCGMAQSFGQLALARIGVGVGEAGSNPPSHSMIADLYPPEERTTAMAIFGTGINWGILIGFLMGGWINEWYGWRTAFVVVGLPGIILAAIVRFTVKEPPRGYSEAHLKAESDNLQAPPFWTVARFVWSNPIVRNIIMGGSLMAFAGYASVIWIPTYLQRVHELGSGITGSYLAGIMGIGGALGIYVSGRVADRLTAALGQHWPAWVVAIANIISIPFLYVTFFAETSNGAFLAYVVPAFLGTVYVACGFAILQNQTPLPMRSVTASIYLFITNLIGLGAGPAWVGFASDLFAPEYGAASLRYAMATTLFVMLWSCWHYYRAGVLLRTVKS